jgi:hypothetical protein
MDTLDVSTMTQSILSIINGFLASRLESKALQFVHTTQQEIHQCVEDARFSALIALASRHSPRQALTPTTVEIAQANDTLAGWNPENWSLLETARISFVLSRPDLLADDFEARFNRWFAYADEGESCAYYRVIPLLPEPQRFIWRAAEGCRTNMRSVFTAVACDSPYPAAYFDDVAWNQLVVKALFTETPLSRVLGIDRRLSPALSIMVLDYMDERTSAGRNIPLDAWLCLGEFGDARVDLYVQSALKTGDIKTQCAALLALARTKKAEPQAKFTHPEHLKIMQKASAGPVDQTVFYAALASVD